jgi:hypothetical protein
MSWNKDEENSEPVKKTDEILDNLGSKMPKVDLGDDIQVLFTLWRNQIDEELPE